MNILIVEDVTLIAERIKRLAKEHLGNSAKKINISHTLEDARFSIAEERYDIVFLDLNLNGENGFDLLEHAVSNSFKVIVITANKSEASKAYDLGIFDFISKPITKERFSVAIDRLKKSESSYNTETLSIKNNGQIQLIKLEEITYIKASGHYSEVYTIDNKIHLHELNLEKITQLLPSNYKRIHRSYITNTEIILKYINHGAGKYEVELPNKTFIPISKLIYKEHTL